MKKQWQSGLAALVGATILLAAFLFLRAQKTATAPEQLGGGTIYYTGPLESKGHPGVWADESGKIVAPPVRPTVSKQPDAAGIHP